MSWKTGWLHICVEDPEAIEKILTHRVAKVAGPKAAGRPPFRGPPQCGLSGLPNDAPLGCDVRGAATMAAGLVIGATAKSAPANSLPRWIRVPECRFEAVRGSDRRPSDESKEGMLSKKRPLILLIRFAACGTFCIATAAEESADTSRQELFKFHGCINCHGADGKSPVSKLVPKLTGKPADELYENATKILSGQGATEESKLMRAAFDLPSNCDAAPTDEQVKAITRMVGPAIGRHRRMHPPPTLPEA